MRMHTAMVTIFLLAIGSVLVIPGSHAHNPSDMTLEYNPDIQRLDIMIMHTVADPTDHYIDEITVYRNGEEVEMDTYDSQADDTQVSYSFDMVAEEGDLIRVVATCNQAGFIEQSLTIQDGIADDDDVNDDDDVDDDKDEDAPFPAMGVLIGSVLLLVAAGFYKRKIR